MEKLVWTPEYSVGIEKIDRQHRYILTLIDKLASLDQPRVKSEEVESVVSGMISYAMEHFQTEEDLMSAYGYPDFLEHKKEHLVFLERAADLSVDIMESKEDTPENTLRFLRQWWHNHILNVDMAYRDFLKERGVE